MKKIRIGINGFGRIGRLASRIILERPNLEISAINSPAEASSHAYLLKYDSIYGTLKNDIKAAKNKLHVDNNQISIYQESHPNDIPWDKTRTDLVIDASGKFRTANDLSGHRKSGIKYVVLSSPAKDDTKTIVLGVNENDFQPQRDKIISNSSCTTNCLANIVNVVIGRYGIVRAFMTTTHAVTDTQNLLDNSHKKEIRLRRGAYLSLIPSSTGSAKDIVKLFPQLLGKIACQALRVPLATVSLVNLTCQLEKTASVDDLNQIFTKAATGSLKGILAVSADELVSADYIGSPFSAIVDPFLTAVLNGTMANIYAWYDNEWGYANRLIDLCEFIGRRNKLI